MTGQPIEHIGHISRHPSYVLAVLLLPISAASPATAAEQDVPWMPSASDGFRQGFVRVISHDSRAGDVRIDAWDNAGKQYGPLTLFIDGGETVHFNSRHLEEGSDPESHLSGATGPGEGDWRLVLSSDLDIEVLGYIRTQDGFLTAMREFVPRTDKTHRVVFFNPASNRNQVSLLRLTNPGQNTAAITVGGTDDHGRASARDVSFSIPAGATRALTSHELESGEADGLRGALGEGNGKWRLTVSADRPIRVMSVLSSPTGHFTNLSSVPNQPEDICGTRTSRIHLFPSTSHPFRQGFLRVMNGSPDRRTIEIRAFDDEGREYGPTTLAVEGSETMHINSDDLEFGNAAKGLAGIGSNGTGDWHLQLRGDLEVEALAYIRTADGFLTSMHDVTPKTVASRHRVVVFNPASNINQVSRLRLINPGDEPATVTIRGIDDGGGAEGREARLSIPPGGTRTLTSRELESGDSVGLSGALGDGEGKWRLSVASNHPIQVMSLIESPTGHLTNLSLATDRVVFDDTPKPDLVSESISFDHDQVLSLTLENVGMAEVPAGAGAVKVFVDGWLLRTYPLADLSDQSFRMPRQKQTIVTGLRLTGENRRIAVVVDPANEIDEINEFQNTLTRTVSLSAMSGPDIVVRSLFLDEDGRLGVSIENVGDEVSAQFAARLRVYLDDTVAHDLEVAVPEIEPNDTASFALDPVVFVRRLSRVRVFLDTDATAETDNTNGVREESMPTTAAIAALEDVLADAAIAGSLKWQDAGGVRDYESWSSEERAHLERAFLALGSPQSSALLHEPPPPPLSVASAWEMYVNHVAQSLWVEVHGAVPWSLRDLPEDQLEYVLGLKWAGLDYRRTTPAEYAIRVNADLNPRVSWEFMWNLGLLRSSQLETIHALIDWMRGFLVHFSSDQNSVDMYGYHTWRLDKVLYAPEEPRHVSLGCPGTSNLFATVLANVNIPAYATEQLFLGRRHTRPVFPSVCRSMPHGDDVYDSTLDPSGTVVPSSKILYRLSEMEARFVAPEVECDGVCNTASEQALVNSVRDLLSHAHGYMADSLLKLSRDRLLDELRGIAIGSQIREFAEPLFDEGRREAMADAVENRQRMIGGGDAETGRWAVGQRHLAFECRKLSTRFLGGNGCPARE